MGEVFVLERDDGIGDAHEETGDGGVEGYLDVVEGNLETESEEEEYAAPDEHAQSFLFVVAKTSGTFKDEEFACEDGSHHGHGPGFGDVSGLDNDDVIAAKAEGQAAKEGKPGTETKGDEGDVEA